MTPLRGVIEQGFAELRARPQDEAAGAPELAPMFESIRGLGMPEVGRRLRWIWLSRVSDVSRSAKDVLWVRARNFALEASDQCVRDHLRRPIQGR